MAISAIDLTKRIEEVAFQIDSGTIYRFRVGSYRMIIKDEKDEFELINFTTEEEFYTYRFQFDLDLGAMVQRLSHSFGVLDIITQLNTKTATVWFYPAYKVTASSPNTYNTVKYKVRKNGKNFTAFSSETAGIIATMHPISIITKEQILTLPDFANF